MAAGFETIENPIEAPRTPPRDRFENNFSSEKNGTGRKTRGSLASDSSEESAPVSPVQPFLAYGRRRRSFASPFQLNKTRYLLSFESSEVAEEWWALIQSEYPDSVRESPQLFSFKSDKIPSKACDNPKLAHLKDKWSYRQLEEPETKKRQDDKSAQHRRASVARTPSMPTLREGSVVAGVLEDPFTPSSTSIGLADKSDFAQLNITSDRIHKAVSQSTSQLDAMIEGQQAGAKGMQKLQATIERMTDQMEVLAQKQQEQDDALQELQSANMRLEDPQQHLKQIAAIQALQPAMKQISTRVQDLCERPAPAPGPSKDSLQKLQVEVSQNTTALKTLTEGHKVVKKNLQSLQKSLDDSAASQKALAAQMKQMQTLSENAHALTKRLAESQDARFEQLSSAIDRQAVQTRKLLASQQEGFKASLNQVLDAVKQQQMVKVGCGHEVIPPPRKVHRKLVGYVYEKE